MALDMLDASVSARYSSNLLCCAYSAKFANGFGPGFTMRTARGGDPLYLEWRSTDDFRTEEAEMRVMEFRDWGLDNLRPNQRPDPTPQKGEVVVRIDAASVNYRDLVMSDRGYGRRSGELPLVPISDGAGTVVATGPEVSRVAVGDLVCPIFSQTWLEGPLRDDHWTGMLGGPRDGVLQELMLLHEDGVVKIPGHLESIQAAALPCAAVAAWNAVIVAGRVKAGDTVLTQGTGGTAVRQGTRRSRNYYVI